MYDLLIVGGGMAAFSAALYSSRRGLKTVVLAKDIGGQANYTDVIENYPGLAETRGHALVSFIRGQAEHWGAEVIITEINQLKAVEGGFVVSGFAGQYKGRAVILAFGKTPMDLGVAGEEQFKGRGVSYCATCDAPLAKGRVAVVAGFGDLGLDAALLAAKFAQKVYTLSKTDKLIGHPALLKKVKNHKKIELVPFVQIQEVYGDSAMTGLKLLRLKTGKQDKLPSQYLFVELGYVSASGWLSGIVDLDEHGQIIIGADQATSLPGVFAAGDATNRPYKQAVISAGEGAAAALAAFDWLARQDGGAGMTSDWTHLKRG